MPNIGELKGKGEANGKVRTDGDKAMVHGI
jgi:hypothetical protein